MIAIIATLFIGTAHLSILDPQLRFNLMIASVAILTGIGLLHSKIILESNVAIFLILATLCLGSVMYHGTLYAPATEFAANKRTYFLFVWVSGCFIFPFALRHPLSLTLFIYGLIFLSFIYATFAFTNGETDNIRQSALELNPVLHSKLLFFPVLYMIVNRKNTGNKRLLFMLGGFSLIACLFTGSRGAIIVAALCFIIYRLRYFSLLEILKIFVLLIIGFILLVTLLNYMPEELAGRYTLEYLMSQTNEGDRIFLYQFAWDVYQNNPEGIGLGNMSALFWLSAPHNIFLESLMDLGWLYATPYIFVISASFYRAILHLHAPSVAYRFVAIWFIFMFLNSMIGGEMSFPSLMLYISMGLVWITPLKASSARPRIVNPQRMIKLQHT